MSGELFRLLKLRRREIVDVFKGLSPPQLEEMHGEYRASLLDQGHWTHNILTLLAFNMPGVWISKSFRPISECEGRGYNTFRIGADVKKIYRMKTYIGASRVDDRDAYLLDYGAVVDQDRVPAMTKLSGEVRKLDEALYLGVGTADFGVSRLRRQQPFILEGPFAAYDETVWCAKRAA